MQLILVVKILKHNKRVRKYEAISKFLGTGSGLLILFQGLAFANPLYDLGVSGFTPILRSDIINNTIVMVYHIVIQ